MLTTYILAGGNDTSYPEYGVELASAVGRHVQQPVIVSCFFSRTDEETAVVREPWDKWFGIYFPGSKIIHATTDKFEEQIRQADVVYLHGGSTQRLLPSLASYPRFSEVVQGKVVIGSSAGANALSSVCISSLGANLDVRAGLGILPNGVAVHYRADKFEDVEHPQDEWDEVLNKLRLESSDNSILCLPEGKFAIVVQ